MNEQNETPSSTPIRELHVATEQDQLNQELCDLESLIMSLRMRLECVLREETSRMPEDRVEPVLVPLANEIRKQKNRLTLVNEDIRNMLGRMEI
jgi:hypothetical protein